MFHRVFPDTADHRPSGLQGESGNTDGNAISAVACDCLNAQSADSRIFRHRSRHCVENADRGNPTASVTVVDGRVEGLIAGLCAQATTGREQLTVISPHADAAAARAEHRGRADHASVATAEWPLRSDESSRA
jgi:hypothetical protein